MLALFGDDGPEGITLEKPGDVWKYVEIGDRVCVEQQADGPAEDGWYLSINCNCDWEEEHGLLLVFRDGTVVSRVGPSDGHLTNSHAFGEPGYDGVIYVPMPPQQKLPASFTAFTLTNGTIKTVKPSS